MKQENPYARRLGDQIRQVVAQALEREVKDPRLGFVTITDVRVTGDMREASVFWTSLGSNEERAASAAALKSATGMLRTRVARQIPMKHTPSLTFVHDALPESAAALEEVLAEARRRNDEISSGAAEATYAGEEDPYKKPREDAESTDVGDVCGEDEER